MATLPVMCGRVIQSSGPLRYGIVEGMDVSDSRAHNYPPRWNAAPSQHLLVIRRNHGFFEWKAEWLRTFAVITTGANELVAQIH